MNIKKRFASLFSKASSKTVKETKHHHKRSGFFNRKKLLFFPIKILILLLLLVSVGAVYAQAPLAQAAVNRVVRAAVAPFIPKPEPLTQADQTLPVEVQQAIEVLARQQIKQEQAHVTLPVNVISEIPEYGVLVPVGETIEEVFTRDAADRARLLIRKNDRLIAKLQRLLLNDKSDRAIARAVGLIEQIDKNTDINARNKALLEDRELLGLRNAQYIRLQLIIQQIEDTLPMQDYLIIEDARQKHLVKNAVTLISSAPSLEAVFATGVEEVNNVVGEEFSELKAMEFIADFTGEVEGEAGEKLRGLEKQLAVSFEKKMLKLPRDVRNRKLQSYIHYSFGDPLLQIQAFERMKDNLTDREVIMGVDSLKEVAIRRLTDRIFELESQEDLNLYVDGVVKNPQDIKILGEMQLAVQSGRDEVRAKKLAQMEQSVQGRIARFFESVSEEQLQSYFVPQEDVPIDVMDVLMVSNLEKLVTSSAEASPAIKTKMAEIKRQSLNGFIESLNSRDFLTRQNAAYNPVAGSADVRVLLSSPQGVLVLQSLRSEIPASQRFLIDRAITANTEIAAERLLTQVNNPDIFADYEQFISQNREVNQAFERFTGRDYKKRLEEKSQAVKEVAQKEQQQLYEVVQQITQSIFASRNTTDFEKQLPAAVVTEIASLKRTLPARNIPQLTVPDGVTLSPIAVLPHDVQHAIVQAAKARIRDGQKSEAVKLDLTVSAADLGIAQPRILPGGLLYPLKQFARNVQLLLTFDRLSRAELLVKHNNERTLEAALLLEKSSSRQNINLALQTLAEVQANFDLLRKNTAEKTLPRSERVDRLINAIIQNGIARQTVFASIEDKVYGTDYVRVEKIRQQVLRDGIDTLLQLSDDNAQLLVERLEQVVGQTSGSTFKELKAIELLDEIRRFQPEEIDQILEASEIRLAKAFEAKLLAMDKEERERELLAYATGLPGNPVRQYEAYESLRNYFEDKDLISLVDRLQSRAIRNFVEIVSGITDEVTIQEFATEVVGTELQDLRIVIEAQSQVKPLARLEAVHTPLELAIEEIKTIVEQEIVQELIENPTSLTESGLLSYTSNQVQTTVTDVAIVQDIVQIIEQAPEALPELVQTVQALQQEVISNLVETEQTTLVSESVTTEETLLQETIVQVQEEIFSAPVSDPSPTEETLPQTIQTEIEQIKTEVATEEVPTVTTTTETTVTVESVQTSTETQIQIAPTETTTIVESAPAPVEEAPVPAVGL